MLGSRQVGKSSLLMLLIKHLLQTGISSNDIFYFNLDDMKLHALFKNLPRFIEFLGKSESRKYVFVDEIQRLDSPGLFLKEVYDLKRNIKIIYSGSSQLEIKAKTKEHLVGRSRIFTINRLTFQEQLGFASPITKNEAFNNILLYGSYPAVAKETREVEKQLRIKDIYQAYVQKDLVDFLDLKDADLYNKLLIRIAMQTGDLLSTESIAKSLKTTRKTVEEYLSILEQTFICKRIYPFHKNYKKEITKTPKIYFLDLGLRNFILNNFNNLNVRTDKGSLFENFVLTEILSNDYYSMNKINFWRTTNKTEIDFIVQGQAGLQAIEVKWSDNKTPRSFKSIESHYPGIKCKLTTTDDFVSE
ncbi:MAG: ATP-binding protein [Bacteroidales bacterium]|nr:ATP-binding protein [Bacteroidales bacterium]MCF8349925.1 ATP-binding protein [Bacteroidales bacterium]MCF8375442.1 ATP-binding protein [Bacteroidales bacterium]